VISIEPFFSSHKIFVLKTIASFSFSVLKGIAISAEVNLSPFWKQIKGNNKHINRNINILNSFFIIYI